MHHDVASAFSTPSLFPPSPCPLQEKYGYMCVGCPARSIKAPTCTRHNPPDLFLPDFNSDPLLGAARAIVLVLHALLRLEQLPLSDQLLLLDLCQLQLGSNQLLYRQMAA